MWQSHYASHSDSQVICNVWRERAVVLSVVLGYEAGISEFRYFWGKKIGKRMGNNIMSYFTLIQCSGGWKPCRPSTIYKPISDSRAGKCQMLPKNIYFGKGNALLKRNSLLQE